jgi:hypothetical protein
MGMPSAVVLAAPQKQMAIVSRFETFLKSSNVFHLRGKIRCSAAFSRDRREKGRQRKKQRIVNRKYVPRFKNTLQIIVS